MLGPIRTSQTPVRYAKVWIISNELLVELNRLVKLTVYGGQGGRKRLTSDFRDVPSRNIAREATVFIWG